jgi:hypothetical protein
MDHRENLILMYILNAGMWLVKGFLIVKMLLAFVAGLTTIMAFLNQYKTLQKNYATLWIVLYINNFRSRYRPKMPKRKNPERGVRIKKSKTTTTDDGKEKLS